MTHAVALLRGINVGGHNRLPMSDLRCLLSDLGLVDVRTVIQSGNAMFTVEESRLAGLADEIATSIQDEFGFAPRVCILRADELRRAVDACPFKAEDGKLLHFWFLEADPVGADLKKIDGMRIDSEEFRLEGRVFYLHAPEGIGRSKLAAGVEAALGVPATARNLNTIRKLLALADSQA